MKRLLAAAFAVVLVFVLASGVLAAGPFAEEDGYIVGTYEADGFIEIRVNDAGVGAGIGSVTIKTPALGNGQDRIEIYVDGALAEAYVGDEPVEDLSQVETPADDIVLDLPTPAPEESAAPGEADGAEPADGADAPGAEDAAPADAGPEPGAESGAEESGGGAGGTGTRNILLIVAAVVVVAVVVTVFAIRGKKDGKNEQK